MARRRRAGSGTRMHDLCVPGSLTTGMVTPCYFPGPYEMVRQEPAHSPTNLVVKRTVEILVRLSADLQDPVPDPSGIAQAMGTMIE